MSSRGSRAAVSWTSIPVPGTIVGVALLVALLAHYGVRQLVDDLGVVGWGLLALAAYHSTAIAADAIAWRRLLPADGRASLGLVAFARWIGEAVNGLLPVMQLGGNVVRARILSRRGVPGTVAGATVVVDVTIEAFTQAVFALLGLLALTTRANAGALVRPSLVGAALLAAFVALFVAVQRAGILGALARKLGRIGSRRWPSLADRADDFEARIAASYADHASLASSALWHLAGWLLGAGEVWLALWLLGKPVDAVSAIALEGLGMAVRGAAFAVPGALGVQEGSLVVLGGMLGIDAHTCLALSLSKRAREFLVGVPALLAWQLDGGAPSGAPAGR
ncbi:MAG TPA: flippase-like domain-containing protein [Candidatus Binatia bacterium]|nr:flippase-like domain-containing protein [Candidatus Binatia bacterium]